MSYLASPRLHFFGEFIAEPSTINNDPANFGGPVTDPGWNPNGNHRFAFTGTTVTSLWQDGALVTSGNPLIGGGVTTPGAPFAKLVDLDVDVQTASKIYGLQIAVADSAGNNVRGTMTSASFRDFFPGRPLLGIYQSTLTDLQWQAADGSALAALKEASPDVLSVRFIVDLYTGMSQGQPHRGRLAGAIGPGTETEPAHYVAGRRIVGVNRGPSALAELQDDTLTLDVGNIVPFRNGAFVHPSLIVAVQETAVEDVEIKSGLVAVPATALPAGWRELGTAPTTLDRYQLTSGIESLTLSSDDATLCKGAPLGLFTSNGAMVAVEDDEGQFVFPDPQAFPMNPGDQASVVLTALRFGQPAASLTLDIDGTLNPGAPGLTFPASVTTSATGQATVAITTSDPGTPRGPIDGQVFGFGGDWSTRSGILISDAQSAVAIRVFSGFTAPANPKWSDIEAIFTEYHTMYPSMAAILDLGDLNAVKAGRAQIRARLLLPLDNPGHMPVTRDLSAQKRTMVVAWIDAGCPV